MKKCFSLILAVTFLLAVLVSPAYALDRDDGVPASSATYSVYTKADLSKDIAEIKSIFPSANISSDGLDEIKEATAGMSQSEKFDYFVSITSAGPKEYYIKTYADGGYIELKVYAKSVYATTSFTPGSSSTSGNTVTYTGSTVAASNVWGDSNLRCSYLVNHYLVMYASGYVGAATNAYSWYTRNTYAFAFANMYFGNTSGSTITFYSDIVSPLDGLVYYGTVSLVFNATTFAVTMNE